MLVVLLLNFFIRDRECHKVQHSIRILVNRHAFNFLDKCSAARLLPLWLFVVVIAYFLNFHFFFIKNPYDSD